MNYTQSNSYATDVGTGQRLHLQAQAVPTAVSESDMNSLIWSLMEVVKAAGLTGVDFDKATPATYQRLRQALNRLMGNNYTFINAAASPYAISADNAGLVVIDATAGNVVVNLPLTTVLPNLKLEFLRTDSTANTVTINRAGAETIDGATSFTLSAANSGRTIRSNNGLGVWRTPLNSSGLLSASGWQKLPSGLILQWGTAVVPASGLSTSSVAVVFPVSFTAAPLAFSGCGLGAANSVSGGRPAFYVLSSSTSGATFGLDVFGFTTFNQTPSLSWMAIGT